MSRRVQPQPGPELPQQSALSVIARSWALFQVFVTAGSRSVFTKFRAASCHCSASLLLSRHDPFHREKSQTRPPFNGFTQLCTSVSMFTTNVDSCLFLCCSSITGSLVSIRQMSRLLAVECGIHVQYNTNPADLQCCSSTEAQTGFVPTPAQIFAVSTFLILRSPS